MKRVRILLLFSILSITCINNDPPDQILTGHNPRVQKLDSLVNIYNGIYEPAGFAVGVVEQDQFIYAKGFGYKNIEQKKPITANTVFHLASISKSFAAVAVMQLAEKNQLDLDLPLTTYLPYFRLDDPRYQKITLRHILTHRSGIPDVEDEEDYEWENPQYDSLAVEQFVKNLSDRKLKFNPGEKRLYSNFAYDILADVILKVSGVSFETYMQRFVFNPIKMQHTTFLKDQVPLKLQAFPHVIDTRNFHHRVSSIYPYNRIHAASSTLHSNLLDMGKYAIATLKGYHQDNQVLTKASYQALWTEELGWPTGSFRKHKTVWSSGSDIGFQSYFILLPEDSLGVIVLSNCERLPCQALAKDILDILLDINPPELKNPASRVFMQHLSQSGINGAIQQLGYLMENEKHNYRFDMGEIWFLGWRAIQQENYELAIEINKFFIAASPQNPLSFYALAKAYMKKGEPELAIEYFNRLLETDPDHRRAKIYLQHLTQAL